MIIQRATPAVPLFNWLFNSRLAYGFACTVYSSKADLSANLFKKFLAIYVHKNLLNVVTSSGHSILSLI